MFSRLQITETFRKSEEVVLSWRSRTKLLGPKGMESKMYGSFLRFLITHTLRTYVK